MTINRLVRAAATAVVIVVLTVGLGACTKHPSPSQTTYTCCDAADIDREYAPGQTLALHWAVVEGDTPASAEVRLDAYLVGPWAKAEALKSAVADGSAVGTSRYSAATLRPAAPSGGVSSQQIGGRPVSLIPIPAGAAPGYYDLVSTLSGSGWSTSAASIVHVIAAT